MSKKHLPLINKHIIEEEINKLVIPEIEKKREIIKNWVNNEDLKSQSETQLKMLFFPDFFRDILGYTGVTQGLGKWTFYAEKKTETDSTKPDGILGFYTSRENTEKTQVVMEFKDMNTNLDEKQKRAGKDYGTPVEQAFSYASKYDGCKWVIVSNFVELRLYKLGRSQDYYEEININSLMDEAEFKRMYLLLNSGNLIKEDGKAFTEVLSEKAQAVEENITIGFYKEYKEIRVELISEIKNRTDLSTDELVRCAQKFLDRIIFICFCQAIGLVDRDLLKNTIDRGKTAFDGVYEEVKRLFTALDKGNARFNINKFNGGLFKSDAILDSLEISNSFFEKLKKITKYDFLTELNVNILGHIFEQSISDLEELKAELDGNPIEESESKRKKDGIYYTPDNITKHIIEKTVGKYLTDKYYESLSEFKALELKNKYKGNRKGKKLSDDEFRELKTFEIYRDKLKAVKVLDPACGSGAFLVQVFDYLYNEYRRVENIINRLSPEGEEQISLFDLNKEILNNNIYGVDINEESVEITKLSLWLKTAEKDKTLASLDNNIKCGNSIITSEENGNNPFIWKDEFKEVFEAGGFDIIVGNPPYIDWYKILHRTQLETGSYYGVEYDIRNNHDDSQPNIYMFFMLLGSEILKTSGIMGYITSQEWLNHERVNKIKSYLMSTGSIENIIFDSHYSVFVEPSGKVIGTNSSITIYEKDSKRMSTSLNIPLGEEDKYLITGEITTSPYKIDSASKWNYKGIDMDFKSILEKIEKKESIALGNSEYFDVFGGFQPPVERIQQFLLTCEEYNTIPEAEKDIVYNAFTDASSIQKYYLRDTNQYWVVANAISTVEELKAKYTVLYALLDKRIADKSNAQWYKFPNIRNITKFNGYSKKIVSPRSRNYNAFALDNHKHVFKGTNTAIGIKKDFDVNYVLGVLNSSALTYWYHIEGKDYHGLSRKFEPSNVEVIRIPVVSEEIQKEIADKTVKITEYNAKLENTINVFQDWLNKRFALNEIRVEFLTMDFDVFYEKQIKKKLKSISAKELKELRDNYEEYEKDFKTTLKERNRLYKEIDTIVYKTYGHTEKEISTITDYVSKLY